MVVCAHGDVAKYCSDHGMVIHEELVGEIEEYEGICRVIVTDKKMGENEFYALKLRMLRRGIELVSTRFSDSDKANFVAYLAQSDRRTKHGGRRRFGENSESERLVVARILELHDAGRGLREIAEDENVRREDGRELSVSTISFIIRNREKYER